MSIDPFSLDSYDYDLPEERIAQYPPERRGSSRLLVLDKNGPGSCRRPVRGFTCLSARGGGSWPTIPRWRPPVCSARGPAAARRNCCCSRLLLWWKGRPAPKAGTVFPAPAEALLKPGRSIHPGDRLGFGPDIEVLVEAKHDFGRHDVRLFWRGSLTARLEETGRLPLPPYIRREQGPDDRTRYQTLYARPDKAGSVAAPTAGLHFTDALRARLADLGFPWLEVTLHVGYGTFKSGTRTGYPRTSHAP